MDILECFQLQMPEKSISKWPKQREFIGLHKKSSGLAGPKDADDVKITFPLILPPDLSLILVLFPGESLHLVAPRNYRPIFFQLQVK